MSERVVITLNAKTRAEALTALDFLKDKVQHTYTNEDRDIEECVIAKDPE